MCHGPRSGSSCQSLSFTGSNGLLTSTTSRSSRSSVPSSRDGSPTVPANRSDAARGFSATRSGSDAEALAAIQFDRLYGNTADGVSVGWVDLDTGKRWMERPEFAEAFERAVNLWRFAPAPDRREITAESWTRTVPLPPACDAFANSSRAAPSHRAKRGDGRPRRHARRCRRPYESDRCTQGEAGVYAASNTGPVVAAADVDRLFGAFQRLATDRTLRSSGHRLGLAIVITIADAHGAVVTAVPRPEGGLHGVVSLPDVVSQRAEVAPDHHVTLG